MVVCLEQPKTKLCVPPVCLADNDEMTTPACVMDTTLWGSPGPVQASEGPISIQAHWYYGVGSSGRDGHLNGQPCVPPSQIGPFRSAEHDAEIEPLIRLNPCPQQHRTRLAFLLGSAGNRTRLQQLPSATEARQQFAGCFLTVGCLSELHWLAEDPNRGGVDFPINAR